MSLQLDPRFPVVWRRPDSVQIGVDAPVVTLERVDAPVEHVLHALRCGVTESGLRMIAAAAGLPRDRLAELLADLAPALRADAAPAPAPSIGVDGTGAAEERIAGLLGDAGFPVVRTAGAPAEGAGLAVLVARHVLAPERHGAWLRRDRAHLPVVFGDTVVRIGPFVQPGAGPCLYCDQLWRTERDPAWPAIAAQLLGRPAATERPLVVAEAALRAARLVAARSEGPTEALAATQVRLAVVDARVAAVSERRLRPHPECGCAALPENGTASAGRPALHAPTS